MPRSARSSTRITTVAALALCLCTFAAQAQSPAQPSAQSPMLPPPPAIAAGDASDVLHGVTVKDPYRSLEDLKSPATQQWLKAEGDYAADAISRIEGRDAMAQRIAQLGKASGDAVRGIVRMPGNRLYYLKRAAGTSQFKLVMRIGLQGAERVLVDPEQLTKADRVPRAINYFHPSWDGKTLAYGVSAGGSEDASLYLQDIASGAAIGLPIARVHDGLVNWAPDSKSFTYNQLRALPAGAADTETFLDSTVYQLAVGSPEREARAIFGPLATPALKLDRLDVGEVIFDPASRMMVARTTDTTSPEGKLFVAPVAAPGGAAIEWRQISRFEDKITEVQLRRDVLYLRSYADAPRGRLIALRLATPELSKATIVVPEPVSGVFTGAVLGRDAVYAQVRSGFSTRLLRYGYNGGAGVDMAPDLAGSAFAVDDPAHAQGDVYFATSTWTEPSRVMRLTSPGHPIDTRLRQPGETPGAPEMEAIEVTVPSHDGALVPLAILRKKGLVPDGRTPVLLIGYGAYGINIDARYDPRSLAWIEQGGVIAYANVRGSSAYGDAWYRAGFKRTKPNTWKDGIACAQYLIDSGYGSTRTMGIWGTSAGGIFVGRSVTTAPSLFAAAIFDVGIMDTVRAEQTANGITNVSEFGTVKDPDEFTALLAMSTYNHIEKGVAYPAVMFVHGLNDPRVDVWQSAKAAARLQAATTSGRPILLRLDSQAGHGIGSTAQQTDSKQADIYSFLLWQFGKVGLKP